MEKYIIIGIKEKEIILKDIDIFNIYIYNLIIILF